MAGRADDISGQTFTELLRRGPLSEPQLSSPPPPVWDRPARPPSLPAGSLADGLKRQTLNWAWVELCSSSVWQYSMRFAHTWYRGKKPPVGSLTTDHRRVGISAVGNARLEEDSKPTPTCSRATSISSRSSGGYSGPPVSACFHNLSLSLPASRPSNDKQRRLREEKKKKRKRPLLNSHT